MPNGPEAIKEMNVHEDEGNCETSTVCSSKALKSWKHTVMLLKIIYPVLYQYRIRYDAKNRVQNNHRLKFHNKRDFRERTNQSSERVCDAQKYVERCECSE